MHFQTNSFEKVVELVTSSCDMASIDLKEAYFTVPITPKNRKYLRFFRQGKLYQFCCLIFCLSLASTTFI